MSRRRRDFKDCDSPSDPCEFCSCPREDHEDGQGNCSNCGCKRFWVEAEEMKAYDDE